jgi:3-oxoadipate enol-lactonase
VRDKGLEGIVDANMERWFTSGFRERSPSAMEKMREMFLATKVDGYVGCGEASATWTTGRCSRRSTCGR